MAIHIPPQLSPFIDRDGERADALRAAEVSEAAGRPLCVAVSGLAGIGKTALAFELVRHAPRDRFPGGVTHLDLDDLRRDGVVEVADVLGDVMRQLGADPRGFEPGLAGRARQYQELTRTRRVAVVLDNARWDTEVVPLLPASGGSLLVVTSHGPLTGLPDGDVLSLDLGPLDDAHAAELLRSVVRDPRLDDADGVAAVVRLCAGLPAALHVAARALRDHRRRTLERLVPRLTVELDERGLPMVERVWDAAYASLAPDAALLYRLLADLPGGSSAAEAAVALLGRGAEAGDDALDDLRNAGLLTVAAEERFRLPDLLRAHARRRARADGAGADAERDAAVTRIVRWYLRQAREADRIAAGDRLTVGESVPELPGAPDVVFGAAAPDGASRAYAWLESERHALHACVRLAHARGMDGEVWSLCEPLWTHFLHNPHYADAVDAFRLGVLSAARAGNARALVRMRCQLARPLWEQDRLAEAEEELDHALAAARLLGDGPEDRKLAASALEFSGMVSGMRGDWTAAAARFDDARRTHEAIGNRYGAHLQAYRLGEALAHLGDLDRAAGLLAEANAFMAGDGRMRLAGRTALALGTVLARLGRADEARARLGEALSAAEGLGSARDAARVHDALADLADTAGTPAEAAHHRAAAEALRAPAAVPGAR